MYKVKAKRTDNREWVEGFLVISRERPGRTAHFIIKDDGICNEPHEWVLVIPDTICRPTGLQDKNGEMIWENNVEVVCTGEVINVIQEALDKKDEQAKKDKEHLETFRQRDYYKACMEDREQMVEKLEKEKEEIINSLPADDVLYWADEVCSVVRRDNLHKTIRKWQQEQKSKL